MSEDSKKLKSKKAPFDKTSDSECNLARAIDRNLSKLEMQSPTFTTNLDSLYALPKQAPMSEALSNLDRFHEEDVSIIWPEFSAISKADRRHLYVVILDNVDEGAKALFQREIRKPDDLSHKPEELVLEPGAYSRMNEYNLRPLPISDAYRFTQISYESIPGIIQLCRDQGVEEGSALKVLMKRIGDQVELVLLISPVLSWYESAIQYLRIELDSEIVDSWELKEGDIWIPKNIAEIVNTRSHKLQSREWRGRIARESRNPHKEIVQLFIDRGTGPKGDRWSILSPYKEFCVSIKEK